MLPYWIVLGVSSGLATFSDLIRKHVNAPDGGAASDRKLRWSPFDLIAIGVLAALAASRYDVGSDYRVYRALYESVQVINWPLTIERSPQDPGFTFVMILVKSLGGPDSYRAFLWVVSLLAIIPTYLVLKRHSRNLGLSIFLFVTIGGYLANFNTMRQAVAVALVFFAWSSLARSKRLQFVVVGLIAISMHFTAFPALIVLVIVKRVRMTAWLCAGVLVGAVLVSGLLSTSTALSGWLDSINPRYSEYLVPSETGAGAYLQVVAFAAVTGLVWYLGSRERGEMDQTTASWVLLLVCGLGLMIIGTGYLFLFRMAMYFIPFVCLAVPHVFVQRGLGRGPMLFGVIAGAATFFTLSLLNYGDLLPYRSLPFDV